MSTRREFITLLGGAAAAWPVVARAEQAERMRRIGVLGGFAEDNPEMRARLTAFRQGLEDLGWLEGRNIRIDARFAPAGPQQARALAKELVTLQPDVILSHTTPATAALQQETRTIPIVFVAVADPIGSRFIASLAHPGGNLTGIMLFEASVTGKWLAMLKEVAPRLERAALVFNPKTAPFFNYYLHAAETLVTPLAIDLVTIQLDENAVGIERAIETFARQQNGGLVLVPDITITLHRDLIIALAARHRLPAVYADRVFVLAGGLMSYGSDRDDDFRQAASYVDRILHGAAPADLPARAPIKYQTALNLRTAKALGLTVPPPPCS